MTPSPALNPTAFARPRRGDGRLALGVCAGLGRRWGVDAALLRVVAVFFGLTGVGLVAYLLVALLMPADLAPGATPSASAGPITEPWRQHFGGALQSALKIAAWGALALAAAVGAALAAVFSLAWVVGILAAALLLIAIVWRRPALAPLPFLAAALALPAAAVALSEDRVERTAGALIAQPVTPRDVPVDGYRRGAGEVLVDLRSFQAAPGSVTKIKAQSDLSRVVVALPQQRCFNLRVHYRSLYGARVQRTAEALHTATNWQGLWTLGVGQTSLGVPWQELQQEQLGMSEHKQYVTSLIAFSRAYNQPEGTWQRVSTAPNSPTLDLEVASAGAAVVQDFPATVGPLDGYGGTWPNTVQPPAPPGVYRSAWSGLNHSVENVARWDRWALTVQAWAGAQARRFAGPCASRGELKSRVVQVPGQAPGVEVNGLGESVFERIAYPAQNYAVTDLDIDDRMRAPRLSTAERNALGLKEYMRRQAIRTANGSGR